MKTLLDGRYSTSFRGRTPLFSVCSCWFAFIVLGAFLALGCDEDVHLRDPALPGHHTVLSWEYQPAPANPADPLWTDVSSYFNSPAWGVPYTMSHVPIHGIVRYPKGHGPFPLVLIVHGNHDPSVSSEKGYIYFLELLASHGIIAVSVDENFLNGSWGEMDARAIMLLRHLQRWRTWNSTTGNPFYHKVADRMGLAGHSRGGEAITVAWLFNTMLHNPADPDHNFNFNLRSLFAIAPVDGQIVGDINPHTGLPYTNVPVVVQNADYFVMHGTHDGDVSDFEGYRAFDRAQPVTSPGTATKSLLWVYGAIHNQWNTMWGTADPCLVTPAAEIISATDEQSIGKAFMSGFYQMTLQHKHKYARLFEGKVRFPSMPAAITLMTQYQSGDRVFIDNYEQGPNLAVGSFPGVTNANPGGLLSPYQHYTFSDDGPPNYLWEQTDGLIAGWTSTNAEYEIDVPPALAAQVGTHAVLSLRVGQIFESPAAKNTPGVNQDFSVVLELGGVTTGALHASSFNALPYPEQVTPCPWGGGTKSVLQTVRIPLHEFVEHHHNWHLHNLSKIRLKFDQKPSGFVAVDDIQIAR
jgi:Chlorophyllase enzyme